MFSEEEIIARKVADRCCRRELKELPRITEIVKECCEDLKLQSPEVIYCETLTRTLSAFYLRRKPYLIYDSCLLEALYIYDSIILSGKDKHDIEKLFYKLIGEELIRNNDLPRCLFFSGRYRRLEYLFENVADKLQQEIRQMISCQSYFLIGHELGHLSVAAGNSQGIPADYRRFIDSCMSVLTDRVIGEQDIETFIKMRYEYFMDACPSNMEEYWEGIKNSRKYEHLVEECYCDLQGLKLLLEHYEAPDRSVRAISAAMNYLILQEAIRSDIKENKLFFRDEAHEASRSMYFSVLRMEILLLTLQINNLPNIEEGFREIQNRSFLTKYWSAVIKKIPSDQSFSVISESDLPDIERTRLVDILINIFYYAHIE